MYPSIPRRGTSGPLLAGLAAFAGLVMIFAGLALLLGEGHVTYRLDDAYIHMAVAKNLVEDGVWGVTKYETSASSSSVLWDLLVALGFLIVGVKQYVPFALNLLFGVILIAYLARALSVRGISPERCMLLVPLFAILGHAAGHVFTGMEHAAQTLFSLVFVVKAAELMSKDKVGVKSAWPLLVLAPLVTSIRYEGLFLIAIVCVLLTFRGGFPRRFGGLASGICVCAMGLLPVAVFGLFMMSKGLPFLPYSVLLKSHFVTPFGDSVIGFFGPRLVIQFLLAPHLLMFAIGLAIALRFLIKKGESFWSESVLLHAIVLAAILLHVEFACVMSWFRYDAYLVVMALFALAVTSGPLFGKGLRIVRARRRMAWAVLGFTILRAGIALVITPLGTMNIYHQQVQMARFFDTYCQGQAVALNDIGTTTFFSDSDIVDVWGLGSREMAEAKLAGTGGPELIDRLTREKDVKAAIVYEHWNLDRDWGIFPPHWVRMERWRIPCNVTCASETVAIYAVDPGEQETIARQLREFGKSLPPGVRQLGP